jgi:hypothetical protein
VVMRNFGSRAMPSAKGGSQAVQTQQQTLLDGAVKIDDARRVLTHLATQCEWRGTGQPGYEKAVRFVARVVHQQGGYAR